MKATEILTKVNEYNLDKFPKIYKDVLEYGLNNIFILECDYSSYDFDSFYSIKYYNNITAEVVNDQWNSRNQDLPSLCYYTDPFVSIKEGINGGIVNLDNIINIMKNNVQAKAERESMEFYPGRYKNCKVIVSGGRKFKGECYYLHTNVDAWGNETAVVYDEKTNTIHEVSVRYLNFNENIEEEYISWVKDNLNAFTTDNISGYGFNKNLSFNSFIEEVKTNYSLESMSYDNVNYPARDKRIEKENAYKAKQAEFKESKMKQLVEWVLTNTEKRGDDALVLAERIFNKRYN